MTTTTHTPTPTKRRFARLSASRANYGSADYWQLTSENGGGLVADVFSKANAEELAECWNTHAAIVAALRGVCRFAYPITHHDVEDLNRARAALKAAGVTE